MLTRRLEAVLSADLAAHDKMLFVATATRGSAPGAP